MDNDIYLFRLEMIHLTTCFSLVRLGPSLLVHPVYIMGKLWNTLYEPKGAFPGCKVFLSRSFSLPNPFLSTYRSCAVAPRFVSVVPLVIDGIPKWAVPDRETNAARYFCRGLQFIKPHVVYWARAPLTRQPDTGITNRAPTTLVIFKLVQLYICTIYCAEHSSGPAYIHTLLVLFCTRTSHMQGGKLLPPCI